VPLFATSSLPALMHKLIDILAYFVVAPFRPGRKAVLAAVNDARLALGRAPVTSVPTGARYKTGSCPLAVCLDGIVGVDAVCFFQESKALVVAEAWQTPIRRVDENRFVVDLPPCLQHFVRDFDLGGFRKLDSAIGSASNAKRNTPIKSVAKSEVRQLAT